ncbi:MAG: helix-turn-helix domain-containing protein [Phycisphaeraceae bacterium]|nr:helix-turn-helix domain-containing protein [Phycisphaerales bacterium]MCB9844286.1 helix-turn-helix domain-containing protein [Phycisphaeraceae bacterium]
MAESSAAVVDRLLSLNDAAAYLGICRRTIYRLIASGELPQPVKVGSATRLPESDLARYIESLKRRRG